MGSCTKKIIIFSIILILGCIGTVLYAFYWGYTLSSRNADVYAAIIKSTKEQEEQMFDNGCKVNPITTLLYSFPYNKPMLPVYKTDNRTRVQRGVCPGGVGFDLTS